MLYRIKTVVRNALFISLIILVGCGNSVPAPDVEQWNTPIFWKVATADDVKNGVKAGYDANLTFSNGKTPLIMAALLNTSPDVIEELLKAGASLEVSGGMSPLMAAASSNTNPEVVRVLLNRGAPVNAKGTDGISPLLLAAERGPSDQVFEMLVEAGANLNDKLTNGASVITLAMKNHRVGGLILTYLAKRGVKIDCESLPAIDEFVAQCTSGNTNSLRAMLDAGISVNKADSKGVLPLSVVVAAENFDSEKFQMLLDRGALPNKDDKQYEAPVIVFFKSVYGREILGFYKEYYRERMSEMDLVLAVLWSRPTKRKQFIASDSQACAKDAFFDVLNIFRRHKADFAVCDRFGNNLMHLAVMGKADDRVIRFLKSLNIDFNVKNKLGDTPDEMLIMPTRAEKE